MSALKLDGFRDPKRIIRAVVAQHYSEMLKYVSYSELEQEGLIALWEISRLKFLSPRRKVNMGFYAVKGAISAYLVFLRGHIGDVSYEEWMRGNTQKAQEIVEEGELWERCKEIVCQSYRKGDGDRAWEIWRMHVYGWKPREIVQAMQKERTEKGIGYKSDSVYKSIKRTRKRLRETFAREV